MKHNPPRGPDQRRGQATMGSSHHHHLVVLLLSAATLMAAAFSYPAEVDPFSPLELPSSLQKKSHRDPSFCSSWRLAVETHNLRNWTTIPEPCRRYVRAYMQKQYRQDFEFVVAEAVKHAGCLDVRTNDTWVFDVDETALSNLEFFEKNDFGPFENMEFYSWLEWGNSTALPTLGLYQKLVGRGIKVVFLSTRPESLRQVTCNKLKQAGFQKWDKLLLLHSDSSGGSNSLQFKAGERAKMEAEGFRIVGNIGDQWSDISGSPEGMRTFKLPNPLYYVA